MTNKSEVAQPAISLPKGGGAIKGIGETFVPNLFTGTGNHSIPIAISPGRNGFNPTLAIEYSSGNGNGIFGLGWHLSVSRISRKTEKGLPNYDETDTFVMSGIEDLVRASRKNVDPVSGQTNWTIDPPRSQDGHLVYRYLPRTEGTFSRIERWENQTNNEIHWRSVSKENTTSIFGASSATRVTDPADERRVFEWLLEETYDTFGNHIIYEYARDDPHLFSREDSTSALAEIYEQNRRSACTYLRRICYGNLPEPLIDEHDQPITYSDGSVVGYERRGRRYAFEIVFDYGDWDSPTKTPHPSPLPDDQQELFGPDPTLTSASNPVPIRKDRFSNFRPRFEIRTLRLCHRVLTFHHFAELGGPTLVRSTDFEYNSDADTLVSLLASVKITAYRKDASNSYQFSSLPSVDFKYSEFKPLEQHYQSITSRGNELPSFSLANRELAMVDLFGDGLPDIVQSGVSGFRYWNNLGDGLFDEPQLLSQIPAGISLGQPDVGFGDTGGDGQVDLLVHSAPIPGFFETTPKQAWQTFKPYESFPSFQLSDTNVRLLDLTGNGLADALVTADDHFEWYQSLGERGFGPPKHVPRKHDLALFPDVFFSDPSGRVRLAGMTGDGLLDIVLIHNGAIEYWPNLGYGVFGNRITMENAPHLEVDFDPRRLFLADLNGSGCADLIYVELDRVCFWFNQNGNRWSDKYVIGGTPLITNADSLHFADVFGTGTATLIWSQDFASQSESTYKALNFCGGVKPYVLTEMTNNLGTTTRIAYAPSTRYFLEDQANGTPWVTALPFPVQVVEKVEVIDHVSKTKLVTSYKYHHGYFDGREREFCGFGRVDQFDTEIFEDFTQPGLHTEPDTFINAISAFHVPPVETRSWFHTGIYFDENSSPQSATNFDYRELTNKYRQEFYQGDEAASDLDDHLVETDGLPHEAYRALKGTLLRAEVYAHDGTTKQAHPFNVIQKRYRVMQLQPDIDGQHGVYLTHSLENLLYEYDREPSDPRVTHELTLAVDKFGTPLRTLAIGYGRRQPDPELRPGDREKQTATALTYTEYSHTNEIDDPANDPNNYRLPLVSEARTFELTGFAVEPGQDIFKLDAFTRNDFAEIETAQNIGYEETSDPNNKQKRLIEHVRTLYRKNDLTGFLPVGQLESLALIGETYRLAFSGNLISSVYGGRVTQAMLENDGFYVASDNNTKWWIPAGRIFLSPDPTHTPSEELTFARRHFFRSHRFLDPFGSNSFLRFDQYDLLLLHTTDALNNRVQADYDYVLLQPHRVTDPNGNRSEATFDTLGMIVATASMGKVDENKGDSLSGFVTELSQQQISDFLNDPISTAPALLGNATSRVVYDVQRFQTSQQPLFSASLIRETHASDPLPAEGLKIQVNLTYRDGFGRAIQTKVQAEAGKVADDGPLISRRWLGSGWTIFNNKGKPVKEFEPFFDDTPAFRFNRSIGTSVTLFYDPLERVVATLNPNHTWNKAVVTPWRQEKWDVNDTALIDPRNDPDVGTLFARLDSSEYSPTWIEQRQGGNLGTQEQAAAAKTILHAGTPVVSHRDSLGRIFLTITRNRFEKQSSVVDEAYETRVFFDVEGNTRALVDTLGRVIIRCDFNMVGTTIHQKSMEAGERWTLYDIGGQAIYEWNSTDHELHTNYDQLRRPSEIRLRKGLEDPCIVSRTVYGESLPAPNLHNWRGRVVQLFDQAGVITNDEYDFKGNLLSTRRESARIYNELLDWTNAQDLESQQVARSEYDALNRPVLAVSPDGTRQRPSFNEANLLQSLEVQLPGQTSANFINNIDYNEKGQRTLINYGNGISTQYLYDSLTARLTRLITTRENPAATLQDLIYTYDPFGNVTHIEDRSQESIFFSNQVVKPDNSYTYDASYRLIKAEGREHIGQCGFNFNPTDGNHRDLPFIGHRVHSNDGNAMRRYTEAYEYDGVGNFLQVKHTAVNGQWTRSFDYLEPSLLEPAQLSNRLSVSAVGQNPPENFTYDLQGNVASMFHLSSMEWDFRDQLSLSAKQVVNSGTPETTYYVYDATGARARKVTESQNGVRKNERLYLASSEIYREYENDGTTIKFERTTLHVMDGKQRIAMVERRTIDTAGSDPTPAQLIRYQYANHLHSTALELDHQGMIISYEEYHPFGTTSYQSVRSQTERKRYRHGAMERDDESGLEYHHARYYAAWLGRWTSCDPAGMADGVNLYASVRNNPIVFVDPNGTDSKTADAIKVENNLAITHFDAEGDPTERTIHSVVPKEVRSVADYKKWAAGQGIEIKGEVKMTFDNNGERMFESEWFYLPGEKPKEEEGGFWSTLYDIGSKAVEVGLNFYSPGGKIGWGIRAYQIIDTYVNTDSLREFAEVMIENKVVDTLTDGLLGRGKKMRNSSTGSGGGGGKGGGGRSGGGTGGSGDGGSPKKQKNTGGGGSKTNNSGRKSKPKSANQTRLGGARHKARHDAIDEVAEAARTLPTTERARYTLERLRNKYGDEAVEFLGEHGKFPRSVTDFEFSHLFPASKYPEFAHRHDLGVLTDRHDHIQGHHGGDVRKDLNGSPLDPDWDDNWGWQLFRIDDDDDEP